MTSVRDPWVQVKMILQRVADVGDGTHPLCVADNSIRVLLFLDEDDKVIRIVDYFKRKEIPKEELVDFLRLGEDKVLQNPNFWDCCKQELIFKLRKQMGGDPLVNLIQKVERQEVSPEGAILELKSIYGWSKKSEEEEEEEEEEVELEVEEEEVVVVPQEEGRRPSDAALRVRAKLSRGRDPTRDVLWRTRAGITFPPEFW